MSRKRVIRLQQAEGLTARVRKRFKRTTMSDHDQPIAANLLAQEFVAAAPNQRWVSDTTEFVIGSSGKLYLAAVSTSTRASWLAGRSVRSTIAILLARPSKWP